LFDKTRVNDVVDAVYSQTGLGDIGGAVIFCGFYILPNNQGDPTQTCHENIGGQESRSSLAKTIPQLKDRQK
jgi:hypothetical protein